MNINKEAINNPNKKASPSFIEEALKDIDEVISCIEKRYNTTLIGNRKDFDNARKDWQNLTQMQVVFATANWKKDLIIRYPLN